MVLSVDLYAPSILQLWIWIPSAPFLELNCFIDLISRSLCHEIVVEDWKLQINKICDRGWPKFFLRLLSTINQNYEKVIQENL